MAITAGGVTASSGYVFTCFWPFRSTACHRARRFPGLWAQQAYPGALHHWLVGYSRLIRGQVLKVRDTHFVQAARALEQMIVESSRAYTAERGAASHVAGEPRHGWRCSFGSVASFLAGRSVRAAPSWGVMIDEGARL